MKNTNKKGFTIVELVIVIAVIAVLSAVLIPTFGSIIESANNAVDTQLVAQINTILAIEDVLGGGVNDAVEIQKVIKENGLKLETKSRGKYIWYDIENKKAVLAGLNETGIATDGAAAEPTASADVNRPVLLSEVNANETPVISEIPKGQFKAAISPENFVEGYLFLSTESADGLAEAIHALRNPEGNVEKTLTDALADLAKLKVNGATQVASLMKDFMNQTAIMTEQGTIYVGEGNNNSITKVLVSSGMKTITAEALTDLDDFPELYIVDLHSGVTNITNASGETDATGVITAGKIEDDKVNGIYFVYCNEEIKAIDTANGDILNLISVEQRSQAITILQIVKVYLNKDASAPSDKANVIIETVQYKRDDEYIDGYYKHLVAYDFPAREIENNEDSVYEFIKYSFYNYSNPNSIEIGTSDCFINEDQQMLIKDGVLTVYAYYQELNADFKINGKCYSSEQVTSMLADNTLLPEGTTTITVISQTATLGSATETSLTIPSGVELLVPTKGYNTKEETNGDGEKTGAILLDGDSTNSYAKFLRDSKVTLIKRNKYEAIDKDNELGETNLTIANGVTLNIASGGSLYVDAVLYHAGTTYQGFIDDKCGVLEINEGAKITSNGNVTAYGIIRGEGEIVANDGTVKEPMTIYDWYGGSNAAVSVGSSSGDGFDLGDIIGGIAGALKDMDLSGQNVCPFNEWRVDNIRVETTLKSSSDYTAIVAIHVTKPLVKDNFTLASSEGNPLFKMDPNESTYIVKTLENDGDIKLTLHGTVKDASATLTIDGVATGISVTIDFKKIPVPLSHFDVHVASDSVLTISNNTYKVLPGSDIIVDGIMNIQGSAKVVVCNSYDVKFTTSYYTKETGTITKKRNKITLELTADGRIESITVQAEKKGWSGWTSEDPVTKDIVSKDSNGNLKYVAIPHKYSVTTPAKFVVNGTLNFAGSAQFAGEITSTKAGATITAASTVKECSFPMGWYIQNTDIGNYWYDIHVDGLHSATVMVGVNSTAGTLAAGTYKFVSVDSTQGSTNMWQKQ